MKVYLGSGGIAPSIFDLGTRWRGMVSFTLRMFYPQGNNPWYPLYRRIGGPKRRSGRGGEEKNSQSLPGIEPSIIEPIAQRYTNEVFRLIIIFWYYKILQEYWTYKLKNPWATQ
jgi:hypothetical protein